MELFLLFNVVMVWNGKENNIYNLNYFLKGVFLMGYCNSWEQAGSSPGPGTPPPGTTSRELPPGSYLPGITSRELPPGNRSRWRKVVPGQGRPQRSFPAKVI